MAFLKLATAEADVCLGVQPPVVRARQELKVFDPVVRGVPVEVVNVKAVWDLSVGIRPNGSMEIDSLPGGSRIVPAAAAGEFYPSPEYEGNRSDRSQGQRPPTERLEHALASNAKRPAYLGQAKPFLVETVHALNLLVVSMRSHGVTQYHRLTLVNL